MSSLLHTLHAIACCLFFIVTVQNKPFKTLVMPLTYSIVLLLMGGSTIVH